MPFFTGSLLGLEVAGSCRPRLGAREPEPASVCQTPQRGSGTPDSRRPAPRVTWSVVVAAARDRRRLLHLHEELEVAAVLLHPVEQQLDGLLRLERAHDTAQLPDDVELLLRHEDLLTPGAGGVDVDGGEDALVGQLAREAQLHVPGALELLEDDLVHLGAGLDERRGEDRQGAAVLDVPGCPEEPLRRGKGAGVHTTGEDPAARRRGEVVGAAQAGDGVEQHDDVVPELDQALGPLDRELGDRGVVVRRPVEGRGDDLTLDRALHVGDLFGPLVDEDDHEVALGVVARDRIGDRLQDQGLAGLRRRDDEPALAFADRRDEVDEPVRHRVRLGLQAQPLLGIERRQLAELGPAPGVVRRGAVDRVEADESVELLLPLLRLALALGADRADHGVALAQAVALDLAERDVDVVRAGQVPGGPHERVVVEDVEDAGDRDEDIVLGDLRLVGGDAGAGAASGGGALAATALAVAVPATPAPAATVAVVVLVVPVLLAAVLLAGLLARLLARLLGTAVLRGGRGGAAILLAALLPVPLLADLLSVALLADLLPVALSLALSVALAALATRPVAVTPVGAVGAVGPLGPVDRLGQRAAGLL